MLHISLAAEPIAHIGSFPVTNSLLLTWIVMAILIILALMVKKNLSIVPNKLQSIFEILIEGLYSFFESVVGHQVKMMFPLIASLFLFILVANWIGLVPGVGTIGYNETVAAEHEAVETQQVGAEVNTLPSVHQEVSQEIQTATLHDVSPQESLETQGTNHISEETTPVTHQTKFVPLFRGPTADLNMTIALALIAVFAMQYFGFKTLGLHYAGRFLNVKNPIMFFVGLLEVVSDASKIISFAFRLFGNIFAGEVLLAVMAFLMPFIAPMPFLMLELFVGFIQALVFSTLTAVFINVALAHEE